MKNKILFFMAFVLVSLTCHADEYKSSGWYAGALGGVNFQHVKKEQGLICKFHNRPGYLAGAFLGFKFNPVRIEAEFAYRNHKIDHLKYYRSIFASRITEEGEGHYHTYSYMANLLYDFAIPNTKFTTYAGVGLGYTHIKFKGSIGGISCSGKSSGLVWQAIAGASYRIAHNTDLGLEYRYFPARNKAKDHGLVMSLKRFF